MFNPDSYRETHRAMIIFNIKGSICTIENRQNKQMKRTFFKYSFFGFLLIFLLESGSSFSQYKNIKIGESEDICEPSVAINLKYPNNMVVGADLKWVFYSEDFGHTWNKREIKSKFGVFGNPCVISDNEGKMYYFHLSDPQDLGWNGNRILDRIVCQSSTNSRKWGKDRSIGLSQQSQHDKELAVFDEFSGNIYLTWTQFDKLGSSNPNDSSRILFTYSDDRGKSWKPPIKINQISGTCRNTNEAVKGAMPAVGPKGEVYIVWTHDEKIYFDKTIDGGITWLPKDKQIAEQVGGWDLTIPGIDEGGNYPIISCDISYGDYHGNIYVSWADQRKGEENTDIWLTKSTDGGKSWSKPLRVNNDASEKHQFFNWMTIDQISGTIYIMYYDRREHEDNKTDVYLAYSEDGGKTFVNQKISESPFEPINNVYFGDYIGLAAHAGYVRPVWTRVDNGKKSIWTAIVDMF